MIKVKYSRESVCMADDCVNRLMSYEMPDDTTLDELIARIRETYVDDYSGIPFTGGGIRWILTSNVGPLANFCDSHASVPRYYTFTPNDLIKDLGITEVHGHRK